MKEKFKGNFLGISIIGDLIKKKIGREEIKRFGGGFFLNFNEKL